MRPARIAVFTHDTFGLGHVRRSLHFIRETARRSPDAAILLITGSPAVRVLDPLPPSVDVLKIPTVVKTGAPDLRPPHLPIPLDEVTRLRARLVAEALLGFSPDVFLVDNFPLGSRRELLPALRALEGRRTRTVLGLRDILDAPEVVRADWERQGMYEILRDLYDRILVYGSREVLDVARAYAIPAPTAGKMHYCGYVTAPRVRGPGRLPEGLPPGEPFLLATGGGGGDGFPLLSAFTGALALLPPQPALILTGPLMGASQRDRIGNALDGRRSVVMQEFLPDLRATLAAAEVVVSMCGYNTAAEIVAQRARALVVPRTWRYGEHRRGTVAGVEWEQRMRAEAFGRLGLVEVLDPGSLNPERLAEGIERVRRRDRPAARTLELDGVRTVADHLLELVAEAREADGDAA